MRASHRRSIVYGAPAGGEFEITNGLIGFFYAAALGVSVATISRVLTRPDLVNERTRERVLKGIERLGYRPNLAARDLRRGRTGLVLLVAPLLGSFFLDILQGAEKAADERGFSVLLASSRQFTIRRSPPCIFLASMWVIRR